MQVHLVPLIPFRAFFWLFCRFFRTSATVFKMMTMYVLSAEETRCFQPSKNIKIQCGIEGNMMKKECSGMQWQSSEAEQFQELSL